MAKQKTYVEGMLDILVAHKLVTLKDADSMKYSFVERSKKVFDNFLLDEGLVNTPDFLRALSQYYGLPSFDTRGYFFDNLLVRNFPKDVLLRNSAIPIEIDGETILFAVSEPDREDLESVLRQHTSNDIEFHVGIDIDISDAVKEYYEKADTEDAQHEDGDDYANDWCMQRASTMQEHVVHTKSVIERVDGIIHDAINKHASDIHI